MTVTLSNRSNAALVSLEAAVAATRSGFACMFSTSDEFETALIAERRAQGHYDRSKSPWPMVMFVGCALALGAVGLLLR